jgi:hypothetical protein
MKFDVNKAENMLLDSVFHVQDHDNKFQFYGIFKSVKPDELTFHICCPEVGSKTHGTYTFPAGSHFTLHRLRKDADCEKWIYSPGHESLIYWKDITEMDDKEEKEMKEEKNTVEEEKNVTELSPHVNVTEWLPCVVSDGAWKINDSIKKGDQIYRIFNKKFDIKAIMTIKSLGYYMICLHMTDPGVDISNIEIDESLRVCQTSSENDPGTLVMKPNLTFNEELKPGCLYRVVDSSLNFKYLMYIRRFTGGYVDLDVMKPIIVPDEMCRGTINPVIETKHEQLSLIDLKDMMFEQIPLGKDCNFKFE